MFRVIARLTVVVGILSVTTVSAFAWMTGVEWLTRAEQIQAAQGLPSSRHVRSQGTILAFDEGPGTINIFHREMQSPDASIWMPAMHMVFHVTTRELLKGLKPGDHIHFIVGRHRGAVMITNIRKAP